MSSKQVATKPVATKQQAQIDYYVILNGWNRGEPAAALFGMLHKWIETYFHLVHARDELKHILQRIGEDDMEHIVEDFVHGRVYPKLRAEFAI
jgi:hypothetical protein